MHIKGWETLKVILNIGKHMGKGIYNYIWNKYKL